MPDALGQMKVIPLSFQKQHSSWHPFRMHHSYSPVRWSFVGRTTTGYRLATLRVARVTVKACSWENDSNPMGIKHDATGKSV